MKLCEKIYDFSNPKVQIVEKQEKSRYLEDITQYVTSHSGVFSEETFKPFLRMISLNIFRALPVSSLSTEQYFEPDDDEPFKDPSWPHLFLVYELLRKFMVSSDTNSRRARSYISIEFATGIVDLFNSEDPRERDYLKIILHRIYGKVMPLRLPIRHAVLNTFDRVIYENERNNGLAELLEILGSIINGLAVPLKEEHKRLLRKGLLPLHLPIMMPHYHLQLSYCMTQFVEKDPHLAKEVLQGLLKPWPATNSKKEVMLLNEIEEVLSLARQEDLAQVFPILFKRIGKCIESQHFQVAERSLLYWNNAYVVELITKYRNVVVPAVYGPLTRNTASHWNPNVKALSRNVQKLLNEMDPRLFHKCQLMNEREMIEERHREEERILLWNNINRIAQLKGQSRIRNGIPHNHPHENENTNRVVEKGMG